LSRLDFGFAANSEPAAPIPDSPKVVAAAPEPALSTAKRFLRGMVVAPC
jgi:hypothetical protein